MVPPLPMCRGCTHYRRDGTCDAFPYGIPMDIVLSVVDHRRPHRGDNGIRFTPKTPEDAAYAADLFPPDVERHDELGAVY